MTPRSSRRPRDLHSLAASLVDDATREGPAEPAPDNPADARRVRENGRLGGLKGGRTRAERLSPERRAEIAKKAAQARWAPRGRKVRKIGIEDCDPQGVGRAIS